MVPELVSAFPDIPILAAGGIADGRGVLASLALGAQAVVIGTKFAVATESAMADRAKDLIIRTSDGGVNTKRYCAPRFPPSHSRTRIYDMLRGKKDWISTHDGRAIINETLRDYDNGVAQSSLQRKYDTAVKEGDYTRLVVYAGTSSGLVTKRQNAAEILDEVEIQFQEQVKLVHERLIRL